MTTHLISSSLYIPTAVFVWLVSTTTCAGGTQITVGTDVPTSQQTSMDQIDHRSWHSLLQRYVDSVGRVNYASWKRSAADQQLLDDYLAHLSMASTSAQATQSSKLAFWINAYNAVTVKGILREYPTSSIRNHTAKLFGYNIWDDLLLTVGGKPFSLNQIEHDVLRKMGEPRIHFAIVCASISCPRLLNEAYFADQLEEQLATNTEDFFANPKNFQFDPSRREFRVSSILDWFGGDFGANRTAQLKFIAKYLPTDLARQNASQGRGSVSYLDYDWGLNDQTTEQASTP